MKNIAFTLAFMTSPDQPGKLATASPAVEARSQADAYDSIYCNTTLELDDGTTITLPPHPDFGMLDDDVTDLYNEVVHERDTRYEREETVYIPEQRLKDPTTGKETGVVMPPIEQLGPLIMPYCWAGDGTDLNGVRHKKGDLVKPAYTIRVVKTIIGDVDYKRLRAGGKSSADVWRVWSKQALRAREREFQGSQGSGSSMAVAPVSPSDSQ